MFLNRHELDNVVSEFCDVGERILRELLVCSNARLGSADTDMCFVDASRSWFRWARVLESVLLGRIPENSIVNGTFRKVLGDALNPRRKAIYNLSASSLKLDLGIRSEK